MSDEANKKARNYFPELSDDLLLHICCLVSDSHVTLINLSHTCILFNTVITKTTSKKVRIETNYQDFLSGFGITDEDNEKCQDIDKTVEIASSAMNKIWKQAVLSHWPYLNQARYSKLIDQYGEKINQRWDLFFQIRFILAKHNKNKNKTKNGNKHKKKIDGKIKSKQSKSNDDDHDKNSKNNWCKNFSEGCSYQLNNYNTIISISSLDQTIDIEDIINCAYNNNSHNVYKKIQQLMVDTGKTVLYPCPFYDAKDKSFTGMCTNCKSTLWFRDDTLFIGDTLQ